MPPVYPDHMVASGCSDDVHHQLLRGTRDVRTAHRGRTMMIGKTYDEMTPSERARLTESFRDFYRARPDITARLFWIPRFLNGYAEHRRRYPHSKLTRKEFLGLVVTSGLRQYEPPPTPSTFELGRQADRVIRLGLESLKQGSTTIDPTHSKLIDNMCKDIEGYEFLTRMGAIDPRKLVRKRP